MNQYKTVILKIPGQWKQFGPANNPCVRWQPGYTMYIHPGGKTTTTWNTREDFLDACERVTRKRGITVRGHSTPGLFNPPF